MKEAPIPEDEIKRLQSLNGLQQLYGPAEERFDRITRLASRLFNVPIAIVSLIDSDRDWFKSVHGFALNETPRQDSFCGHAIMNEETLVVPDALQDERFDDNPLVTGSPNVRFYAGHPIHSPDGYRIGTFCLVDHKPRHLDSGEKQALRDLAAIVENELQLFRLSKAQFDLFQELDDTRRRALIDQLTQIWNKHAILDILRREVEASKEQGQPLGLILLDLDHFKAINDTYGHPIGDSVIRYSAGILRSAVRSQDALGRYGGEEFIIVLPGSNSESTLKIAERIHKSFESSVIHTPAVTLTVTASLGAVQYISKNQAIEEFLQAADEAMYHSKRNGRNRIEFREF
ncbi:hypothetical protein CH373_06380 [Leptospira perolatii]|uniref:diguanylate cyclase n=1 Tax=Leptospira perolatii TaxID=2023191 RepID=A0A2M9ZPD0_9LEPT|nr:sensor domain-containing diguanylate cyclase [Leptospira perolatii]PJZ70887.1 hypothetical protein CH360_05110 [Leptospira perolatii]PJZ73783.1 hypothetical protein CH373_06380 [Leptospira perolatii]